MLRVLLRGGYMTFFKPARGEATGRPFGGRAIL